MQHTLPDLHSPWARPIESLPWSFSDAFREEARGMVSKISTNVDSAVDRCVWAGQSIENGALPPRQVAPKGVPTMWTNTRIFAPEAGVEAGH